ncbi:uncharacterized protein B0J16DRAFT_329142 [Fusarium flagelliforme]|uniref:uncharacterized protein n=1 Tax=Fusarium flagelliforme TaxID=2675880 RepID=UPI001E8E8BEA|nr:uncharacterized protein B0J16DRAFT_329142 [Fusarium flagelliforme]KAH7197795.1 hypothetical protein B0J16DRAFT_329142 [Fusarium flagelliforme]
MGWVTVRSFVCSMWGALRLSLLLGVAYTISHGGNLDQQMQTTSPREGKLYGRTTPGAVGVRQTFCLIFHFDVVFVSEVEPEISMSLTLKCLWCFRPQPRGIDADLPLSI